MYTILAIALGLAAISIHEYGHYEAMRRCGVRVAEVSLLGVPLPWLPSLRWQRNGTIWGVHLFLIGAYVMPADNEEIEALSLRNRLYVFGNGIIANLAYASLLTALIFAIKSIYGVQPGFDIFVSFVVLGLAALIWLSRRWLTLLLPLLTLPLICFLAYIILRTSLQDAVKSGSGGPVAVFASFTGAESFTKALMMAAEFSINLAVINLIPIGILDGGQMVSAIAKQVFGEKGRFAYLVVTIPLFAGFVLYMLTLDGIRILSWF